MIQFIAFAGNCLNSSLTHWIVKLPAMPEQKSGHYYTDAGFAVTAFSDPHTCGADPPANNIADMAPKSIILSLIMNPLDEHSRRDFPNR